MSDDNLRGSSNGPSALREDGLSYLQSSPIQQSPQESTHILSPVDLSNAPTRQVSAAPSSVYQAYNPNIHRVQGHTQQSGDSGSANFSPSVYSQASALHSSAPQTPGIESEDYGFNNQSGSQSRDHSHQQLAMTATALNARHPEGSSPSTFESAATPLHERNFDAPPLPVIAPLQHQPRPIVASSPQTVANPELGLNETASRASHDYQRPTSHHELAPHHGRDVSAQSQQTTSSVRHNDKVSVLQAHPALGFHAGALLSSCCHWLACFHN